MSRLRFLAITVFMLIQSSLGVARAENQFNISVAPDPGTHCHQIEADYAVTTSSTLGVLLAVSCTDRPSRPVNGSMAMGSGVSNTFNRVIIPWRYAPHGAFHNGYFFEALLGVERAKYQTIAGSSADVHFIDTGLAGGYQWFWSNGLNVTVFGGVAHLMSKSGAVSIATSETVEAIDYLAQQSSTNTHLASGVLLGWSF